MGRQTLLKQQEVYNKEDKIKHYLSSQTKILESKKRQEEPPLVLKIEQYRSKFIRDEKGFILKTKSKNEDKKLKELVRYVFNKYKTPDFLMDVWGQNKKIQDIDFKDWYICVATGGSLYKEITKEFLTKKETHIFLNCAHPIQAEEALIFAIAKAECDNDGVSLKIAKSKLKEKGINEYWKQNIRWFAKNTPTKIENINDLVDYLEHKKRENENFSLMGMGHTLDSLTKKMNDWHYDLRRLKIIGSAIWEGHPLNNEEYTSKDEQGNSIRWFFHQIKSAKELQEEGNSQRHCVFGYKESCVKGYCSIWSLRKGYDYDSFSSAKRKITIELRQNGSIVQARGLANRLVKTDEKAIIKRWAKENHLYCHF
jgi:hypothetical protein